MKKTFISPNLKVVKVKPANLLAISTPGPQPCLTEGCSGESFAKPAGSDDLGLDLDDYKD